MKKSFTLVEIMMIITIIALLVAIAIPYVFKGKYREEAIKQLTAEGVKEIRESMITKRIDVIMAELNDPIYIPSTEKEKPIKREKKVKTEFEKDFRSY